jgi:hypothetical protein
MDMNILLALTPFIVFFVVMRMVSPLAGLAAAFVVSVLLGIRQWRRGESVKVLEVGSLALFGALVLYTLIAAPDWWRRCASPSMAASLRLCSFRSPSACRLRCNTRAKACRRNCGPRQYS